MENSHIEWTDNTFNIAEGCEKVSPGCKNCYAEGRDKIWHGGCHWGPGSTRKMMSESYWQKPFKWNEQARAAGTKTKVFCSSLCDVFEDHPDLVTPRTRLFKMIEQTPNLIWQLLTKRPENINEFIPLDWLIKGIPDNVWMGTTVENQQSADERIPTLLAVPASVRFLSCEPLLGPVEFSDVSRRSDAVNILGKPALFGIDWVICGGESGRAARPMHPDWARSLRDQCATVGVSFFFKQWGEYWPAGKRIVANNQMVLLDGEAMYKVGKKAAGASLDGKEHKEFPEVNCQ